MLRDRYGYWLANRPIDSGGEAVVTNKYTGQPAARVRLADAGAMEAAIAAAARAFDETRRMPGYSRQRVLRQVVNGIERRAAELAGVLAVEAGKPIRDARGEVGRMRDTFAIAADEAVRQYGEWLPLDISERTRGCEGIVRRFPLGPCGFITPFNFPLNLAAHKIAPAIAVGCPWVLRPSLKTPISALILGEILASTELPAGAFSILPCEHGVGEKLVTDDRIRLLSFTGSPEVGWKLREKAGRKRVTLELGGNAACIVDRDADLERAAQRITFGAFYQSGQSCISVQRVLAHRDIHAPLRERLVAAAAGLKSGDPLDESTFLGPLISEDDARRVESWVREAVNSGASLLCGGARHGPFFDATWLENVDPAAKVDCIEIFGPVATLRAFDSFDEAVRMANDSRYGLQCGIFTRDIGHAMHAYRELDVGGVVINDAPSTRSDAMPYGGVKESGVGREGVRYAMEEMSEPKLLMLCQV
ncbi:Sulfoacetaldehyde dehydrogenase [Phycisphaerae bacterium RAS1]|nr:Sulfoacetaldehyde dehydrogenase [Phycisphaerae bacterium RAS1]